MALGIVADQDCHDLARSASSLFASTRCNTFGQVELDRSLITPGVRFLLNPRIFHLGFLVSQQDEMRVAVGELVVLLLVGVDPWVDDLTFRSTSD